MTLYITTGFGRMRHLGVDIEVAPAVKSLARLDGWINQIYRRILEHGNKDENHLSSTIALYLYGRSYFLEDKPIQARPPRSPTMARRRRGSPRCFERASSQRGEQTADDVFAISKDEFSQRESLSCCIGNSDDCGLDKPSGYRRLG